MSRSKRYLIDNTGVLPFVSSSSSKSSVYAVQAVQSTVETSAERRNAGESTAQHGAISSVHPTLDNFLRQSFRVG